MISDLTLEEVSEAGQRLFAKLKLKWFFYGNILPEESLKIAQRYEDNFRIKFDAKPILTSKLSPIRRYTLIPDGNYNANDF